MTAGVTRIRIEVRGIVQGVGFRPFVYRIAQYWGIHGFVLNSSEGVVIEAESDETAMGRFLEALQHELPPLARIDELKTAVLEPRGEQSFSIHHSETSGKFSLVPPDVAMCDDCRRELLSAE